MASPRKKMHIKPQIGMASVGARLLSSTARIPANGTTDQSAGRPFRMPRQYFFHAICPEKIRIAGLRR